MNSYRISRQQRIVMEILYEHHYSHKSGERIDYPELIDMVRLKLGLKRANKYFLSSLGRSIQNLLNKQWISAHVHRFGEGRGYFIRMFDIKITNYGANVIRNRALR